jgi:hypothetical protein
MRALRGLRIFLQKQLGFYLLRGLAAFFYFEFAFWLHLRKLGGEDPEQRTGILSWSGMLDQESGQLREGYLILAFVGAMLHVLAVYQLIIYLWNLC